MDFDNIVEGVKFKGETSRAHGEDEGFHPTPQDSGDLDGSESVV